MQDPLYDNINNPRHYIAGRKYEPLEVMIDWDLHKCYFLSNVLKYISRYKRKDFNQDKPNIDDLRKAYFYLGKKIELEEKNVVGT